MSHTYGRQVLQATGYPIMVAASGVNDMKWKIGGITVDWTTVPPLNAASTVALDGTPVPAGVSVLPLGTVMTKITASGKYGPFTSAPPAATTTSAATVIGAFILPLTSAASLYPGDTLTIDAGGQLETGVVSSVNGNNVTLVSALTKTHALGVAVSKFADGRATLTIGECFVLNETQLQQLPGLTVGPNDNPPVFYGGPVWPLRLQVGGTNQPTLAQLLAACPLIFPVEI